MIDLTPNCLRHYKMNDDSYTSPTVVDSTGNSNGTATQNTHFMSADGKVNKAFYFNGVTDVVDGNSAILNLPTGDHTISVWANLSSKAGTYCVICAGDGVQSWIMSYRGPGLYRWRIAWDDDVAPLTCQSNSDATTGVWTHLLAKRDGSEYSFWVDNVKQNDTETVGNDFQVEENLFIGRVGWIAVQYFVGLIDNVMIFDKALSADEIAFLWNDGEGTEELHSVARPLINNSLASSHLAIGGLV